MVWGTCPRQPVHVPGSYFGFATTLLGDVGWESFLSFLFIQELSIDAYSGPVRD